ncbi:polyketide synthase dehydratase domain-containing protein, partial [Streptomyces cinerochromogenes]|uniref:polyketide synthase dehydratase domain-containing protein n=1 Tax=Streptomyces cinerochromogenes TaxID=66422 RepID=UPI00339EFE99
DRPETPTLLTALAHLHTTGVSIDWQAYFTDTTARRIDLPTYAFQHQHYWLDTTPDGGDPAAMGLVPAKHPLLGAMVSLPDSGSVVLTGRLSLATHPWLADHAIGETILLPGTALVELAIHAGDQVGCEHLEELTLQSPLVVPEKAGVHVQVVAGSADDSGRRPVTVYSRPTDTSHPEPVWTEHATGVLSSTATQQPTTDLSPWPPAGAEAVDLDGFYDDMATAGLIYGPVFQGLTAAWRRGDEVFAEVTLPEQIRETAEQFGLHPALLDAALHASALTTPTAEGAALPFSWSGVTLHATGASALRVRTSALREGEIKLEIADSAGLPVASVASLTVRKVSPEQLSPAGAGAADFLYQLAWNPVSATPAGGETTIGAWETLAPADAVPDVVVFRCGGGDGEPDTVRAETQRVLATVQSWLT